MKAFLLTLLLLVVAGGVYAQSPKEPVSHPNPAQEAAKPDERGTEQSPLVIKVLPPLNEDEKTAAAQQERKDKSESDWSLVKLTGVLAIIGVIQIIVFGLQARRLRQTVNATKDAADAALKTARNMETIERAYVKMSHVAPGLILDDIGGLAVQLRVKNFGKTPARVNDLRVDFRYLPEITDLPDVPPAIEMPGDVLAFLVQDDEFFFSHQRALGNTIVDNLRDDVGTVLVWGYVDYTDAFEQRHRAGYGRIYRRSADIPRTTQSTESFNSRSNLDLVTQAAYNYDRAYKGDNESTT